MEIRPEQDPIEARLLEARLRASAPELPPGLRGQVLQRCGESRQRRPAADWSARRRWAGALTSLLIFCWVGTNRLDARNQALIEGADGRTPEIAQTLHADRLARMEADSRNLFVALRQRMRQLALLLAEKHNG